MIDLTYGVCACVSVHARLVATGDKLTHWRHACKLAMLQKLFTIPLLYARYCKQFLQHRQLTGMSLMCEFRAQTRTHTHRHTQTTHATSVACDAA